MESALFSDKNQLRIALQARIGTAGGKRFDWKDVVQRAGRDSAGPPFGWWRCTAQVVYGLEEPV